MADTVRRQQRWTEERPCPICGGWDRMPRGKGTRCSGYSGHDGAYAHCSREDLAGNGLAQEAGGTYAHKLEGACRCGATHGDAPTPVIPIRRQEPRDVRDDSFREVARWEYEGGLVVVRAENAAGDKRYWQLHRTAAGELERGKGDAPATLYRAAELRAADPAQWIFLVEGEKCADALVAAGCVATTTPAGANQWAAAAERAAQLLRRRHVVILPDNDQPGRDYAAAARASLERVCASLRVLELPELGPKEDVADWLARGGDVEDLVRLAEMRPDHTLAHRTPRAAEAARGLWGTPLPPALPTGVPGLDRVIAGLRPESIAVLNGPTGRGKTGLAVQIARFIGATGRDVVYLSSELSARQVLARVVAQVRRVPWLRTYNLGPSEVEAIVADLYDLALRVIELRRGMSIRDVLARVSDELGHAPVLVLDYLQHAARRLEVEDPRRAVGVLADEVVTWARDTRSTGLVLSSVSRSYHTGNEDRSAEELVVAGKEAGEIEYDASVVLFLQAELPPEGGTSPAKLHVSKHRFGPSGGTVGLRFDGAVGMFHDDPSAALGELELACYRAIDQGSHSAEDVRRAVEKGKPAVRRALQSLSRAGLIEGPPYRCSRGLP